MLELHLRGSPTSFWSMFRENILMNTAMNTYST